ncbi:uncharacterized protein LOC134178839 isoform X1 [Corticium candelabrum]|uniref:uncharacterized protein LOC134178839 isoform X1 n=1 Tax=Corticium candelabrum TaxID=121492 RepID=UPI002E26783C|nr:uncharacterized protein LOC134178839 isoform X1 [Corticium candelabrum]
MLSVVIQQVSLPFSRHYITNASGKTVYVYGVILRDPVHFDIDLFTTPEGNDSGIALHISVQSAENAVFFNSKIDDVWGKQLKADTFPFQTEENFLLTIATTEETYDIKVNEAHLYSFKHRVPPQEVKRFGISQQSEDGVKITQVLVSGSWILASLNDVQVVLTSAASTVPQKYLFVQSDGRTVGTTATKSCDTAKFTLTGNSNPYKLRNDKFSDKFLTIRENELFAELDDSAGSYDEFYVTQTNDEYYTFESYETSRSYIGVNQSGNIVPPDEVDSSESNFYNSL